MALNGRDLFSRDNARVEVLLLTDVQVIIIPAWLGYRVIDVHTQSKRWFHRVQPSSLSIQGKGSRFVLSPTLQDTRGGYDVHPVRYPPVSSLAPLSHRMRREMLTDQEKEKRAQAQRFEPPLMALWVRSVGVEAVCCADRRRHPGYGDRAAGPPRSTDRTASRKSPAPPDNTRAYPAPPSKAVRYPRRADARSNMNAAAPAPVPRLLGPRAR